MYADPLNLVWKRRAAHSTFSLVAMSSASKSTRTASCSGDPLPRSYDPKRILASSNSGL